jgi:hypothetical protein
LHSYAAFGTHLNCTFDLPELAQVPTAPPAAWTVEVRDGAAPVIDGDLLGTDTVYGSVQVRSFAAPGVHRLVFDDTGTFDVLPRVRAIVWYPGAGADSAAMRADLLGRVMALAAHADGGLALHASAVAIDGHAIAFLGPKHAGKSTLAMALVRGGARLMTDDSLVLRFGDGDAVWAAPGVQRVRLWDDSASALGAETVRASGAKPTLDRLPAERLELREVPLAACYVVRPTADESAGPIERVRLPSARAVLACVSFSKLGGLAGGAEAVVLLDRAARVTRATPVYEAAVRRDLGRLDALADRVFAWHRLNDARVTGQP